MRAMHAAHNPIPEVTSGARVRALRATESVPEIFPIVVLVSAIAEWDAVRGVFPDADVRRYPLGEWFPAAVEVNGRTLEAAFVHGGWGKVSAAASAQYAVDRWKPCLLVNLGTCGGFEGAAEVGDVILARRTVVYDIVEQMADYDEAIEHYATDIDLSWIAEPPMPVTRAVLVSGDRDLFPEDVAWLRKRFGAVAGDWESGAIAYVARHNDVHCLILRVVSDVVGDEGSEAYGNLELYRKRTDEIMGRLVAGLPGWLQAFPFPESGACAARGIAP